MKKIKTEKYTNPISLSAKKSGPLKHQMLFTPYKIQWKNIQPTSTSQPSSRTFFNTMKNELSNLKNDVEKLIKKEGNKLNNKNAVLFPFQEDIARYNRGSTRKQNCQDITQNEKHKQKPQQQKMYSNNKLLTEVLFLSNQNEEQQNQNDRFTIQRLAKQLKEKHQQLEAICKQNKLQKNLIQQLKKENYTLYNDLQFKIAQEKKIHKQSEGSVKKHIEQIDRLIERNNFLEANLASLEIINKNKQVNVCDKINTLQIELQKQLQNVRKLRTMNEDLKGHNIFLQQTIQGLSSKIESISGKYKQKQFYIRQLQVKLQALRISQRYRQKQNQEEIGKMKSVWQKELQCKQFQMQSIYNMKFEQLQTQYNQRANKLENQYKHRISNLQQQLIEKQKEKQMITKKLEVKNLQQLQLVNQKKDEIDFKLLGTEYQRKLNELVQTNYELKNKITYLQSQMEKLQVEKEKLEQQVKIYEELNQKKKEEATKQQWEKVALEINMLKNQKEILIQDFQLKIMKLENQLQAQKQNKIFAYQIKSPTLQSVNAALKQQIALNMVLKQKLRDEEKRRIATLQQKKEIQEKHKILSEKLAIQQKISSVVQIAKNQQKQCLEDKMNQKWIKFCRQLQIIKKNYITLQQCLINKNKQISAKNEFIQKVLIQKIGKKEEEDEINYLLQKIKLFCSS